MQCKQGCFLHNCLLGMLAKSSKSWKQIEAILFTVSKQHTHFYINSALTIEHSVFSIMAGLTFHENEWIGTVLANRFSNNNLLGACQEIIMMIFQINQTNKYKEKLVNLESVGIIVMKHKETRVITYTCRYSSGHFNPYNSVLSG